jgi:hypothetical protein
MATRRKEEEEELEFERHMNASKAAAECFSLKTFPEENSSRTCTIRSVHDLRFQADQVAAAAGASSSLSTFSNDLNHVPSRIEFAPPNNAQGVTYDSTM